MSQMNPTGLRAFRAAEDLEAFRRVKLNSDGDVVYADANDPWIGTTETDVDDGEPVTVRLKNVPGTRKMIFASAAAALAAVYGADDGKVDDGTSGGLSIGIVLDAPGAAGIAGEVLLDEEEESGGLVHAIVADSTQVENTTDETTFSNGSRTIAGADLRVGDVIRVRAQVFVEDNNANDTLTVKLYLGTEEIVTTGAVDVADNDIGYIDAEIVVRAVGASGAISGTGVVALGAPGTVTAKPFRKAQATEDLSANVALTVKATWSAAHADNECELEHFTVEILRQ